MKFILYILLAIELVTLVVAASPVNPQVLALVAKLDTYSLDGKDIVTLMKQLDSLVKENEAPKSVVEMVKKLAPFADFSKENCTLSHFNSLTSAAGNFRSNENIGHYLDYCRAEQLMVCNQEDPKFSTMIAMNGNPSHLGY